MSQSQKRTTRTVYVEQKVLAQFQTEEAYEQDQEERWQALYGEAQANMQWALHQLTAIRAELRTVQAKRRQRYAVFPFPFNLVEQAGYRVLDALERVVTKLVLKFGH
jgi:hypothetical protein